LAFLGTIRPRRQDGNFWSAYQMAKSNNGAPGLDGVTFEAIEESGAESFLTQIREELVTNTYRPMRARKKEIPKDGGKVRVLSIPAFRDRVVQGALKLILEPIFETDFQAGSYGYRPKRTAHDAVARVAQAIVEEKTRIIELDLKAYFDNVQHLHEAETRSRCSRRHRTAARSRQHCVGYRAWIVLLQDVDAVGAVTEITAGYLRAGLREVDRSNSCVGALQVPCRTFQAVPIGELVRYRIPLVANARRFKAGHCVRLFITSDDQIPDSPTMLGFRHASVGTSCLHTIKSSACLILTVLTAAG
jgi:hypothetical protein